MVGLSKLTSEMLDAIEEWMKQDDETTASQLVKMLGESGFKISKRTAERARKTLGWTLTLPSHLIRIFSMIRGLTQSGELDRSI